MEELKITKGTKLFSPICGDCAIVNVVGHLIEVSQTYENWTSNEKLTFDNFGLFYPSVNSDTSSPYQSLFNNVTEMIQYYSEGYEIK